MVLSKFYLGTAFGNWKVVVFTCATGNRPPGQPHHGVEPHCPAWTRNPPHIDDDPGIPTLVHIFSLGVRAAKTRRKLKCRPPADVSLPKTDLTKSPAR